MAVGTVYNADVAVTETPIEAEVSHVCEYEPCLNTDALSSGLLLGDLLQTTLIEATYELGTPSLALDLPFLEFFCYHERVTDLVSGSVTYADGVIQSFSTVD